MKKLLRGIMLIFFIWFLIIGIPMGIDLLFYKQLFISNFEAADVLSYYGAGLGGIATLIAVLITFKFENKFRKVEGKLKQAQQNLWQALSKLNPDQVVVIEIDVKNPMPTISNLQCLSLEIRSYEAVALLFDADQKKILEEALAKIADYAKTYAGLMEELIAIYRNLQNTKYRQSLVDKLGRWKKNASASPEDIHQLELEINGLNGKEEHTILEEAGEKRMEIVQYSLEHFSKLQSFSMNAINDLEAFYDRQMGLFT